MTNFSFANGEQRPEPIHRLIYVSRVRGIPARHRAIMKDVMTVSIRLNEKVGITGALLFCGGWFVQALEGALESVSEVYQRICADPRHEVLEQLTFSPIIAREFGHWSMCGSELSDTDAAIVRILSNKGHFDASRLLEQSALSLLRLVRDLQTPKSHLESTSSQARITADGAQ